MSHVAVDPGFPLLRNTFGTSDQDFLERMMERVVKTGLTIQDVDGRIVYFNSQACDLLRMTPDDLSGRGSLDPTWQAVHLDGSDYPGETHPPMRAIATGETIEGDVLGVRVGDLSLRWLSVDSRPISLEAGRFTVNTFVDVTGEIDHRRGLSSAVSELEAMLTVRELPTSERVRFAAGYRSMGMSEAIGGDFFGIEEISGGRYSMYLGDVCGHGIQSAVLGSIARSTMRAISPFLPDPSAILHRLHEVVLDERPDTFLTAASVIVEETATGARVAMSSGGHPPAIVVSDGRSRQFGLAGPLVGMIANSQRPVETIDLVPGDRLLLVSDGVYEAASPRLTFDEVLDALPTDLSIDDLVGWLVDLSARTATGQLVDDVSVVGVEIR